MAILVPSQAYVRCFNTDEVVRAGSINLLEHSELAAIRILLYKYNLTATSERLRAKIYSDSDYSKLLYTGEWSNVADIPDAGSEWWGWLRLNFNREFLNRETTYYVAVEVDGYTFSDGSYLSASYDWPLQQNSGSVKALAMQIYGYRETD
jgi:hypothetical protein